MPITMYRTTVSRILPSVVWGAAVSACGDCATTTCALESASTMAAARLACQWEWMPGIARAYLGIGRGPGVARKLPQVLVELAQKVLCGLCWSALHDQTLQLCSLL